jgi:Methionyl-tRNA formyltransferase
MVVIHPSLLPRYRGASPIQYALLNGDQETGVSIIEISKNKFDAGKILLQDKLHINPTARYEELQMDLAVLGNN